MATCSRGEADQLQGPEEDVLLLCETNPLTTSAISHLVDGVCSADTNQSHSHGIIYLREHRPKQIHVLLVVVIRTRLGIDSKMPFLAARPCAYASGGRQRRRAVSGDNKA